MTQVDLLKELFHSPSSRVVRVPRGAVSFPWIGAPRREPEGSAKQHRYPKELKYAGKRINRNLTSQFRNGRTLCRSGIARIRELFAEGRPLPGGTMSSDLPAVKPGTNTSFASLKQIDAGLLERGIRGSWPRRWRCGDSSARLASRHLRLCRRRPRRPAGGGYRVIVPHLARLRLDALSFPRNRAQRPAIGGCARHHRFDGCAQNPKGNHRRFRLGCPDSRHHGCTLARTLQGDRLGEWLPDRQSRRRT